MAQCSTWSVLGVAIAGWWFPTVAQSAPRSTTERGSTARRLRPARDVGKLRAAGTAAHGVGPRYLAPRLEASDPLVAARHAGAAVVTVVGSADSHIPKRVLRQARTLGRHAARRGYVTVSGACPGVPQAAIEGAKEHGGATGGFSPYGTIHAHEKSGNPTHALDFIQLSSLPPGLRRVAKGEPNFMGREATMIERADAVVVFRGRSGTLSEISMALSAGRPIGVVVGTGGIADGLREVVAAIRATGTAPTAPIFFDTSPTRLLSKMERAIEIARLSRKVARPTAPAERTTGRVSVKVATPSGLARLAIDLADSPNSKIPHSTRVVGARREAYDPLARLRHKTRATVNVVGTSTNASVALLDAARNLGEELASRGYLTMTTAGPGVSQAAIEGAKRRHGATAGISPFSSKKRHELSSSPTQGFDLLQLTNHLSGVKRTAGNRPNYLGATLTAAERADALVVAGGGTGSLFAVSAALENAKPIGVLLEHGGVAEMVRDLETRVTKAGKAPAFPILYDTDPKRLVQRMEGAIEASRQAGHRGPLGDGDFGKKKPAEGAAAVKR